MNILKRINEYPYPQWVINILAFIMFLPIIALICLSAYSQYVMNEKIMAIPSDGDITTVGK